jgi:hypothetical protein
VTRKRFPNAPNFWHASGPRSHSAAQPLPTSPDTRRNFPVNSLTANPGISEANAACLAANRDGQCSRANPISDERARPRKSGARYATPSNLGRPSYRGATIWRDDKNSTDAETSSLAPPAATTCSGF